MEIADKIGELSTCPRKAVGAVIIRDGRAISWGYNGAPPGTPHCEENHHGWDNPMGDEDWRENMLHDHGCRNATHAEANAICFAAKQGISTDNSILLVGVSPCRECARLIIASGIREVYYRELYRDQAGVDLLEYAGVQTWHIDLDSIT